MNIIGIGRLGRDPEVKHTAGGQSVCEFSLAWNVGPRDNQRACWVRCSVWGARGDAIATYVKKGDRLFIVGRLDVREYEGKDGTKRTSVECRVDDFEFIERKREDGEDPAKFAPKAPPAPSIEGLTDDIPF